MPQIKSAIKRVETNKTKTEQNKPVMTAVKTALKTMNSLIDSNQIEEAEKFLPSFMSILDEAVSKNVIRKNNASNKISAVSKKIADIKAGKKVVVIKKDNKTIAAEKAKAAKAAREAEKKAKKDAE